MAGLVGWVSLWEVGPLGTGPQDPQNPIHHLSAAAPRPSAAISSFGQLTDQRFENGPLFVGEIHDGCILLIGDSLSSVYEISCSHLANDRGAQRRTQAHQYSTNV